MDQVNMPEETRSAGRPFRPGAMICPKCGSGCRVIDSRPGSENSIRRRRVCTLRSCAHRFTTFEIALDRVPMLNFEHLTARILEQLAGSVVSLHQLEELVRAAREADRVGKR